MKGQIEKSTVELFAEELYEKFEMKGDGEVYQSLLDKFKELEKERIIKAYNEDLHGGLSGHRKFNDGEDYYNKTYGGNE